MVEPKKNIMSNTEALLKEISAKLDIIIKGSEVAIETKTASKTQSEAPAIPEPEYNLPEIKLPEHKGEK